MQITTATALLFDLCLAGEHRRMMLLRWPPIGFIVHIPSLKHCDSPQGVFVLPGKEERREGDWHFLWRASTTGRLPARPRRPSLPLARLWQWMLWPTSPLPTQRGPPPPWAHITIRQTLLLPVHPCAAGGGFVCILRRRTNRAPQLCCQRHGDFVCDAPVS